MRWRTASRQRMARKAKSMKLPSNIMLLGDLTSNINLTIPTRRCTLYLNVGWVRCLTGIWKIKSKAHRRNIS